MAGIGLIFMLFLFAIGVAFYLLPTIVAMQRKVARSAGIVMLNIFLGWTFLGWLAALIWACSAETQTEARLRELALMQMARGFSQPPPPRMLQRQGAALIAPAPNETDPRVQ